MADADVRATAPDELDAWSEGEWMSWGYRQGAEWRRVLADCDALGVFRDGHIVGGTAGIPFALTVPGGELPVRGIASVWVSPAWRGKGYMRRLMDTQLEGFVGDGVAAAVLIASEPGIHRRFGFGVASFTSRVRVSRSARSSLVEPEPGEIQLTERDTGVPGATQIYDRVRPTVPGMLDRGDAWWEYSYPTAGVDDDEPTLFALHRGAVAECDGYAAYSVQAGWSDEGRPDNTLRLHELVAETPRAYGALWSYCLGLSLCGCVEAENRPVDEPLLHMLPAPEAMRLSVVDGLHVRILDVPAALSARRYSARGSVVLSVRDDAGGWAGGTWLVEGDRQVGACTSTRRSPDLVLDAAALACVYLGGSSFDMLHWAGFVDELRPGAIRRADELFSWSRAPWLPWDY
jgi:predicted acetyltransferase